ncbi:MAG TPA: hypothetical protein VEQ84_16060, partial [Vicinamibacteria bacterium]|nr:hypothetical protein [Vicinamibacteria bacterium]
YPVPEKQPQIFKVDLAARAVVADRLLGVGEDLYNLALSCQTNELWSARFRYGDSPYLSAARLGIWRRDLDRAIAPALTLTHGQESAGARAKASALLQEIGGRSLPGPFDADRLLLVAEAWVMISDRAEAMRIYELVAERFPNSVGARKAEEWIRSDAEAQAAEQRIKQTP